MEFRRVHGLPRRTHVELQTDLLHEILRRPGSTMSLQPLQVWALQEARKHRGIVVPIPVGGGKTLVSFLIPTMVEAQRPLILLPASVIKRKTLQIALPEAQKNFYVQDNLRFLSYEKLSREGAANFLDIYQPDHVIADEAQCVRNTTSAGHRRLARYFGAHPEARFYPLTGTFMSRSLRQGYILAWWALREGSPLPHSWMEVQDWADVLDEKVAFDVAQRPMPGALLKFCAPHETLAQGFERRLQETPGWIYADSTGCRSALRVEQVDVEPPKEVVDAFKILRGWKMPDGEVVTDAKDICRHALELVYGYYNRWKWPPGFPEKEKRAWLHARREYRSWVRNIIKREYVNGRHFDTEEQVANARRTGFLTSIWSSDPENIPECDVYEQWHAIKDTVKPETEAVWISDYMLKFVEKWLKTPQSIAWVDSVPFLEKMRERGMLCFGGGEDEIDDEALSKTPRSCVASFDAHYKGRNLQGKKEIDAPGYWRNLFLATGNGERLEQGIGRTHRQGQEADEVECFFVLACKEMWKLFQSAMQDARNVHRDGQGQRQKLIFADVSIETEDEINKKTGPLWV